MSKPTKDPFVVSDATCKGCFYYGYLSGVACKCCDYTFLTGKLKPAGETCAECSVKKVSRRTRKELSLLIEKNRRKAR